MALQRIRRKQCPCRIPGRIAQRGIGESSAENRGATRIGVDAVRGAGHVDAAFPIQSTPNQTPCNSRAPFHSPSKKRKSNPGVIAPGLDSETWDSVSRTNASPGAPGLASETWDFPITVSKFL